MKMNTYIDCAVSAILLASIAIDAGASTMFSTNYGDFSGTSVTYRDVNESSGTDAFALYGAPAVVGNTLNFSPDFTAYAAGAGGSDTTDGQLGFDVYADSGNFIDELSFSERGDFLLSGFSGDAYASVSANFFITIYEVDGVELTQSLVLPGVEMTFTPNVAGEFLLSSVGGPSYGDVWAGDMTVDIKSLLSDNDIAFNNGATRLHLELNNTLVALSQDGTQAFIAKKGFHTFSVTVIPEPASVGLLGFTTLGLFYRRRVKGRSILGETAFLRDTVEQTTDMNTGYMNPIRRLLTSKELARAQWLNF